VLITPVDCPGAFRLDFTRLPARASSRDTLAFPDPISGRHPRFQLFEACSSFTRVTARRFAHPPDVGLVGRLRHRPLPGGIASQLHRHTETSCGGTCTHWWVLRDQARTLGSFGERCKWFLLFWLCVEWVCLAPVFGNGPAGGLPSAGGGVESRKGAVSARRNWAARFLSPLIKPDVPISSIRLSDRLHTRPTQVVPRANRCTPSRPKISPDENRRVPLVE